MNQARHIVETLIKEEKLHRSSALTDHVSHLLLSNG